MAQPESRLSRRIRIVLQSRYPSIFIFKVWGSEYMMRGLPDLIGCYDGRFFGFEVKMPDKRKNVSASQVYVMSLIKRAGGITGVVCTANEAIEMLEAIPD